MSVLRRTIAALLIAGVSVAAFAHHSFTGQFDIGKPGTITGTVSEVKWANPHAMFFVNVADAKGSVSNWRVEMGSPITLLRYHWKRDTVKVGDKVTVDGYLGRDGSYLLSAKTVKLGDGTVVSAGSATLQGYAQ
jgi:WD40 repeat protein